MNTFVLKPWLFLFIISLLACKSDEKKADENRNSTEVVKEISKNQKHLQNIARAHNTLKFEEEEQVKFKLKFDIKDEVFFDGFVTLKTDGTKARFLDSRIDKIVELNKLETELDKKLIMIIEAYTMGFWLRPSNFIHVSKSDSLDISSYKSDKTQFNYTIYTHPITHIIQKIDYNTDIAEGPFDLGTLFYDKYITVNRIPISLLWEIKIKDDLIAKAKITRISYPDSF